MTDTDNERLEGIVLVVMGFVFLPVSILAGGFTLSGAWLAWGLLGFVLVGIAGAVAFIGPYCLIVGWGQYTEAAP